MEETQISTHPFDHSASLPKTYGPHPLQSRLGLGTYTAAVATVPTIHSWMQTKAILKGKVTKERSSLWLWPTCKSKGTGLSLVVKDLCVTQKSESLAKGETMFSDG